jgi:hypothetical protein
VLFVTGNFSTEDDTENENFENDKGGSILRQVRKKEKNFFFTILLILITVSSHKYRKNIFKKIMLHIWCIARFG